MKQYLKLLEKVLKFGNNKNDRTKTGTISLFAQNMRFNLQKGLPVVTTKKIYIDGIIHELLWFLSGSTNISYLNANNVNIWNDWANDNGDLGPVYGAQWRKWPSDNNKTIDQIANLITNIKKNPNSRRHIVSAWNVSQLQNMALPPCHLLFQFYVFNNRLSCQLYQRSADMFLGVPFNIVSYCLLLYMVAQQCQLDVGEFIWVGGDCHIYNNHKKQVLEQISREVYTLPILKLNKAKDIFSYKYNDFIIDNYRHHPAIKAPISI